MCRVYKIDLQLNAKISTNKSRKLSFPPPLFFWTILILDYWLFITNVQCQLKWGFHQSNKQLILNSILDDQWQRQYCVTLYASKMRNSICWEQILSIRKWKEWNVSVKRSKETKLRSSIECDILNEARTVYTQTPTSA